MSFTGTLDQLRRSVAVRLSLWFTVLFAVGFTAVFAFLYVLLGRQLEAREVEALRLRLQQYADIYEARGVRGLELRIDEDSAGPHVRSLFVRLVSPRGDVVWASVPPDWIVDMQAVAIMGRARDQRRGADSLSSPAGGWTDAAPATTPGATPATPHRLVVRGAVLMGTLSVTP